MYRSVILIFTVFLISISAQPHFNSKFNYEWDDWNDWDLNFDYDRPFIELNYGVGEQNQQKFNGHFPTIGLLEIKLGYLKESRYEYGVLDDRKESFFFGSKIAPTLTSDDLAASEFESTLWRFGFASRNTLGYYGDPISILPYHQDGFAWSRLEAPESKYPILSEGEVLNLLSPEAANDYRIIDRYRDSFRFGTIVEGGIRLEFEEFVSLNAGYEAAVIFPRHLFWKQAGSYIIEKAGEGALNYFINEVTDATPEAGPIVRFLLLNAYSYAFHLLKQDDMNWPFTTEEPLTYETLKFGVTFTF